MSSGEAAINAMIRKVRKLPKELQASAFAETLEAEAKRTASAGTTPNGTPWAPTVDGGRALEHAADRIQTVVAGRRVILSVHGPAAIHNYGTSKDPKRQILPTILPQTWAEKLKAQAKKIFRRVVGGR